MPELDDRIVEAMALSTSFVLKNIPFGEAKAVIKYLKSKPELSGHNISYSPEYKSITTSLLEGDFKNA